MYKDIDSKLGLEIENINIIKSGWAGEIISLKAKARTERYIIKTYNSSKNGLENIKQEWEGLNLLYNASYPVPKPIIVEFIGEKPYIIMEEIDGEEFWAHYEKLCKEEKEHSLDEFVRVLCDLHELDISIVDNKLKDKLTNYFIEKEISEIKKIVKENKLEGFTQIIAWIEREKANVINNKLSIIHRDFHPWNVIVDKSKKIYVIDLLWGVGDYRFDLAWTCTLMERSGFEEFSHEVLKKYTQFKNMNIHNFEYFKVFSTLRWLINIVISLKTGENLNETRSEEFKNFIFPLIKKGLALIEEITHIQMII